MGNGSFSAAPNVSDRIRRILNVSCSPPESRPVSPVPERIANINIEIYERCLVDCVYTGARDLFARDWFLVDRFWYSTIGTKRAETGSLQAVTGIR